MDVVENVSRESGGDDSALTIAADMNKSETHKLFHAHSFLHWSEPLAA